MRAAGWAPGSHLAIVRYYVALFARSQRWLPPVLLYAGALAIQAGGGDYTADSFGYSSALLLPTVGWSTRALLTSEPEQARDITASVHGPAAARIGALSAAACFGLMFAAVGAVVAIVSGRGSATAGSWAATAGTAQTVACGAAVEILCVGLGTAAGAVGAPPVITPNGWSILVTAFVALGFGFAPFSPANQSIRALIGTSKAVPGVLLTAGPIAVALTALAWFAASRVAARR
jgi:hypothetical protein